MDLHNINTKLNETEIMLCTPFRPMLGQRAAIDEVSKIIPQNIFIIETKIDGERMQLHKNGNEFRYFSRNSNDYTQSFGATRYRGTLTSYISDSFKTNIRTCILDGEMVGYDPATNDFVLKGSNVDIKSDNLTGCHPCFVVFDVLLINDENLANVSLKERIQKLEGVFDVTKGRIQHVERKIGSTRYFLVFKRMKDLKRFQKTHLSDFNSYHFGVFKVTLNTSERYIGQRKTSTLRKICQNTGFLRHVFSRIKGEA